MKFVKDLFLYFSAFIPLFFLLLIKLIIDLINKNIAFNFLNIFNIILNSILILCGIFGILINTKFSKQKIQKIKIVSENDTTDKYFLQYFSLFVLFAVPLDISFYNEFFIYLIVLILISIVYMNCDLFYINPTLNLLGYHLFEITFLNNKNQEQKIKIFSKFPIEKDREILIKIKNKNFAFVTKQNNVDKKNKM